MKTGAMMQEKQTEAEIQRLNSELKAANQNLEAFNYSVSHDLRAPLRHILGYVDILQTAAGQTLDETSRQHLQTIARSAAQMGQMIDALEAAPYVERYAIYNWVGDTRAMVTNNALTPAGIIYRDKPSTLAYSQAVPAGGNRGIAQYHFENNALDTSGYGNNGLAVGIPDYAPAQSGQGVVLDGTNS